MMRKNVYSAEMTAERNADAPAAEARGEQRWTTRALLNWITRALRDADVDSPRLSAELLLAHVLDCERLRLYTDVDRPATESERARLRELVARALKHEPVQYLVGEAWFFGLPFSIDQRAMIPRPSTETLVETTIQHMRPASDSNGPDELLLADVGVGSGAIAVALLKNLPRARVIASDISTEALELARGNAERHGVADRLDLLQDDLLEPIEQALTGRRLHALLSNPPYIPDHEWEDVQANVKHYEPESALRAGPDGLRFVRPIVERAPNLLAPGGLLCVEIASSNADEALRIAQEQPGLRDARIEQDGDGLDRALIASRRDENES